MTELCLQERFSPASRCFGCGPANPHGLRIRSFVKGQTVLASWQPAEHHQAFPGMLNGGIIGTLLDCHSNWTAAYTLMKARAATSPPCTVTAEFHVKLQAVTPLGPPLRLVARATEVRSSSVVVEAELFAEGQLTATCRGVSKRLQLVAAAFKSAELAAPIGPRVARTVKELRITAETIRRAMQTIDAYEEQKVARLSMLLERSKALDSAIAGLLATVSATEAGIIANLK